jgi:outer membrane biosynthesis protein TonB
MSGQLKRIARPAIGIACILALTLSFVLARAGAEPQDDGTLVPAIPATEPAAAKTTSVLGPARGLPGLAPESPRPPKREPAPPATPPAPPAAPAPAPAPAPPPEPAYTPRPEPVTPAPPTPEPAPPEPPAPQPDPSPPVYFDDSG